MSSLTQTDNFQDLQTPRLINQTKQLSFLFYFPNSASEHQHSSWASKPGATKSSTARPSTGRPLTRPEGRALGPGPAAQGGAHPTEDPAPPRKGITRGEERENESGIQHSSST